MASSFPTVPVTAGPGPAACDLTGMTQADFEAVAAKVLPEEYLAAMRTLPDSGYELVQMAAKVAERISVAIRRTGCGSFILYSVVGVNATGQVTITRPDAGVGDFTVVAGTIVGCSCGGRWFVLKEDLQFTGATLSATGAVEAVRSGYEYNVPAGYVDGIVKLVTLPAYAETRLTVANSAAMAGGTSGMLEGLGSDRGLTKIEGESEEQYRLRVRSLPDTISPDAVVRNVTQFLAPWGLTFSFIELWSPTYQTCWDAPDTALPNPDYDPNLFAYDDERDAPPWRDFWLDEQDARGAFIICLELASVLHTGMAFDDTGMGPGDFHSVSPQRQRGTPAFDVPSVTDPALVFPGAYDGEDVLYSKIALGVFELLQQIKAAGVSASVERYRNFP